MDITTKQFKYLTKERNSKNKVLRYVYIWEKEDSQLFFFTFPMIHIGKKIYYEKINKYLFEMNHILYEGVKFRKRKSDLGKYRYIAKIASLSTQYDEIVFPDDTNNICIDMDGKVFEGKYKKINIKDKLIIKFMNLLIWLYSRKYDLRKELIDSFSFSDNSDYNCLNPLKQKAMRNIKQKSYFKILIENERDNIFEEKLSNYINENLNRSYRLDVGIILGDYHMPIIYEMLNSKGYKWKLIDSLDII